MFSFDFVETALTVAAADKARAHSTPPSTVAQLKPPLAQAPATEEPLPPGPQPSCSLAPAQAPASASLPTQGTRPPSQGLASHSQHSLPSGATPAAPGGRPPASAAAAGPRAPPEPVAAGTVVNTRAAANAQTAVAERATVQAGGQREVPYDNADMYDGDDADWFDEDPEYIPDRDRAAAAPAASGPLSGAPQSSAAAQGAQPAPSLLPAPAAAPAHVPAPQPLPTPHAPTHAPTPCGPRAAAAPQPLLPPRAPAVQPPPGTIFFTSGPAPPGRPPQQPQPAPSQASQQRQQPQQPGADVGGGVFDFDDDEEWSAAAEEAAQAAEAAALSGALPSGAPGARSIDELMDEVVAEEQLLKSKQVGNDEQGGGVCGRCSATERPALIVVQLSLSAIPKSKQPHQQFTGLLTCGHVVDVPWRHTAGATWAAVTPLRGLDRCLLPCWLPGPRRPQHGGPHHRDVPGVPGAAADVRAALHRGTHGGGSSPGCALAMTPANAYGIMAQRCASQGLFVTRFARLSLRNKTRRLAHCTHSPMGFVVGAPHLASLRHAAPARRPRRSAPTLRRAAWWTAWSRTTTTCSCSAGVTCTGTSLRTKSKELQG